MSSAADPGRVKQLFGVLPQWAWVTLGILLAAAAATFMQPELLGANTVAATQDAAKATLLMMKEWAVWMAGIQSATLAAIGLMAKEKTMGVAFAAKPAGRTFVILSVIFNAVALLLSAWLLTSLSSMMLRVASGVPPCETFDVYARPLYAWIEDGRERPWLNGLTLGFIVAWNHILWAAGIMTFAVFCVKCLPAGESALDEAEKSKAEYDELVAALRTVAQATKAPSSQDLV